MTIEQTIYEVQVARPAAAGAHRESICDVGLCSSSERSDLFMPHMEPLDLALPSNSIRQTVRLSPTIP